MVSSVMFSQVSVILSIGEGGAGYVKGWVSERGRGECPGVGMSRDMKPAGGWYPPPRHGTWDIQTLLLTPSGGHQNMYSWQAGSMHPA